MSARDLVRALNVGTTSIEALTLAGIPVQSTRTHEGDVWILVEDGMGAAAAFELRLRERRSMGSAHGVIEVFHGTRAGVRVEVQHTVPATGPLCVSCGSAVAS